MHLVLVAFACGGREDALDVSGDLGPADVLFAHLERRCPWTGGPVGPSRLRERFPSISRDPLWYARQVGAPPGVRFVFTHCRHLDLGVDVAFLVYRGDPFPEAVVEFEVATESLEGGLTAIALLMSPLLTSLERLELAGAQLPEEGGTVHLAHLSVWVVYEPGMRRWFFTATGKRVPDFVVEDHCRSARVRGESVDDCVLRVHRTARGLPAQLPAPPATVPTSPE